MINTQTDDTERKGNIAVVAAACCMVLLAFLVVGLKVRGRQLETSFAVCGILQRLIFLGFPDPHPTGDHICAPPPADQQSDHLHRPWIHSLRRVPLLKNHPKKSEMGLKGGNGHRRVLNKGFSVSVLKHGPRFQACS